VTITPDAPLSEAARILLMTGLRRLPVVVKNKLVGIVTVADIVGAIGQMDITAPIKAYVKNGIVAVWEDTPVSVVSEIIRLSKHDALPVLNSKSELTGIITITDLINMSRIEDSVERSDMSSASDEDKWTWESMRDTMSLYYGVSRIKLPDVPVKNVMIKDVITAFHKTPVSDCAKKMRRNRIEQVPVITADNKLDGLLLDRDLLSVLVHHGITFLPARVHPAPGLLYPYNLFREVPSRRRRHLVQPRLKAPLHLPVGRRRPLLPALPAPVAPVLARGLHALPQAGTFGGNVLTSSASLTTSSFSRFTVPFFTLPKARTSSPFISCFTVSRKFFVGSNAAQLIETPACSMPKNTWPPRWRGAPRRRILVRCKSGRP